MASGARFVNSSSTRDVTSQQWRICSDIEKGDHDEYHKLQAREPFDSRLHSIPDSILSIDSGDEIETEVWVGTANGTPTPYGSYAFFYFYDWTQHKAYGVSMSLGSRHFNGQDAEWIMERPEINGGPTIKGGSFALLSDYGSAAIADAYALKSNDAWVSAQTASNAQLWLYNNDYDGQDNNLLSSAELDGTAHILLYWNDFH